MLIISLLQVAWMICKVGVAEAIERAEELTPGNWNRGRNFQRNASGYVKRLKESGLPELLTVKGRAELVVQTARSTKRC